MDGLPWHHEAGHREDVGWLEMGGFIQKSLLDLPGQRWEQRGPSCPHLKKPTGRRDMQAYRKL